MPKFTINLLKDEGVEVIDHELNVSYKFSNDQKSMGTSIFENYHHDANGESLRINNQPDWLNKHTLTFDISVPKYLDEARAQLAAGPGIKKGGSRRRRPSRKYKKSAKRVFRKKSRSTRRR